MITTDNDSIRPDAPTISSPPEWWPEIWDRRQFDLRERILRILREGPKIDYTHGSFVVDARNYDRREVDVAVESLVDDGSIERFNGRYRMAGGG